MREREREEDFPRVSARFSAGLTIVIRPPVSGIEIGKDRIVLSDLEEEAPERLASLSSVCFHLMPELYRQLIRVFPLIYSAGIPGMFLRFSEIKTRPCTDRFKRFDRLDVLIRELITSTDKSKDLSLLMNF